MLILQPTSGEKTITIAPRTLFTNSFKGRVLSDNGIYEESTCLILFQSRDYSINLRRDGDGKEETITNLSISGISNFTNVVFNPTILEEDSTYYLEITKDTELWYRDKIYVTSQTASERVTEKHDIGNGTIYKPYSIVDDNTYII
jgi:hypothetical protein